MDGWTDRIAINSSHKCGDMRQKNENKNYYHTFSSNENRKILATLSLNLGLGLHTTNFVGLTIVRSRRMCEARRSKCELKLKLTINFHLPGGS